MNSVIKNRLSRHSRVTCSSSQVFKWVNKSVFSNNNNLISTISRFLNFHTITINRSSTIVLGRGPWCTERGRIGSDSWVHHCWGSWSERIEADLRIKLLWKTCSNRVRYMYESLWSREEIVSRQDKDKMELVHFYQRLAKMVTYNWSFSTNWSIKTFANHF